MSAHSFPPLTWNHLVEPVVEPPPPQTGTSQPASAGESVPKTRFIPELDDRHFIKITAWCLAVFMLVLLFVFQDVKYRRELYRVSRMVAAAEAGERQNRQWVWAVQLQNVVLADRCRELEAELRDARKPAVSYVGAKRPPGLRRVSLPAKTNAFPP